MEIDGIPSHNHPKRNFSIKSKARVQLVLTSLSNSSTITITSETRYPNSKGAHVSTNFVKPPSWRS
jgi:hypothetical protein